MLNFLTLTVILTIPALASASHYSKILDRFNAAQDFINYSDLENKKCISLRKMNPDAPIRTSIKISEGIVWQEGREAQHIPAVPAQVTYPYGPLLDPVIIPARAAMDIAAANEILIGRVLLEIDGNYQGKVDRAYMSEEQDTQITMKSYESGRFFMTVSDHEYNYLTIIRKSEGLIFFRKTNEYVRSKDPEFVGYCW